MIAAQRKNKIKEIILTEGSAKIDHLSELFEVSEETIRRDLSELEKSGYVKKNYGGAVAVKELQRIINNVPPVQQRKFNNLKEKEEIGRQAAQLVKEDMRLFIDAGSTTWSVLRYLNNIKKLSVVTNSVDVAYECADKNEWDIYVMGGQLLIKSMCTVGTEVEKQLDNINVDIAFLGISGVHENGSLTSSNLFEANIKRKVINIADRVVLAADHTKFGISFLHTFGRIDDIDIVITSDLLDPGKEERILACDTQLIKVPLR
jgi:DeoR/GlpR family transcriptional regulator of sugar metabolism